MNVKILRASKQDLSRKVHCSRSHHNLTEVSDITYKFVEIHGSF